MNKSIRIISGGQTGADRAATDFAIQHDMPYGGWIPKGRLAEDGEIPRSYKGYRETASADYPERTRLNVIESDGTLIISHGQLKGGSLLTIETSKRESKPYLHIDLSKADLDSAAAKVKSWIKGVPVLTLNVAGARASDDPLIYPKTQELLTMLFD